MSKPQKHQLKETIAAVLWVVISWVITNAIMVGAIVTLPFMGVDVKEFLANNVVAVGMSVAAYVLVFSFIFFLPKLFKKKFITKEQLGVRRPKWKDVGLGALGIVIYYVFTMLFMLAAMKLLPWINITEKQDVGLTPTSIPWELALIFVLLVIVAPIVEELIFRGYLYGRIRSSGVSFVVSTLIVSVLFGIAHMQWNVGLDTFVISIVMCLMRELSGSIWPGVMMHMIKNGLAFYLLFFTDIAQKAIGG